MRTIEVKLYQYAELSDRAKEKAREWWLSCRDGSDYESVIEDAQAVGELLGLDFTTRPVRRMNGSTRQDVNIWYRLAYGQGDGASFDARYGYVKGAAKAVRQRAPQDKALHDIADRLQAVQRAYFYRVVAHCKGRDSWTTVDASVDNGNRYGDSLKREDDWELSYALRAFGGWIYAQLRLEDEYQSSEKAIAEAMAANEYEFTEDGARA